MNLMQNWTTKHILRNAPGEEGSGTPPVDGETPPIEPAGEPETPDYSWMPEEYRSEEGPDFAGFQAHYDEIVARQAVLDEARGEVPEDADGYELAVPEDLDFGELDLPEGFTVDLQTDSPEMAPLFAGLKDFMHEHQLPKDAAQKMMGLLAQYEATKYSTGVVQNKAEMKLLGTAAKSRIADVQRSLEKQLNPEELEAIMSATRSAAGVKALEKIFKPRGFNPPPPTPNGADVDSMTPSQRLELANSRIQY